MTKKEQGEMPKQDNWVKTNSIKKFTVYNKEAQTNDVVKEAYAFIKKHKEKDMTMLTVHLPDGSFMSGFLSAPPVQCPECTTLNDAGAKFCDECAAQLKEG